MLKWYKLLTYVEGKVQITKGSMEEHQDQLILSWLLTSVSLTILPQVAALTTSFEVWECLNEMHTLASEMRLLHFCLEASINQESNQSMIEYLKNVSIAKDLLAVVGEKLKESQLILITLSGLGPKYSPFVTSITTRFDHTMRFATWSKFLWTSKWSYLHQLKNR